MALKRLEDNWKTCLNTIMENLSKDQFEKMMLLLEVIPTSKKSDASRMDLTQLIVQYYGTEKSIHVVTKILNDIPRRDAVVQEPLRLILQELEQYEQKNTKNTKGPGPAPGPGRGPAPAEKKKKSSCPPPARSGQTKGKSKSVKDTVTKAKSNETGAKALKKTKSVDDAAGASSSSVNASKRKFDEAEALEAQMMKDDSFSFFFSPNFGVPQRSEVTAQSSTNPQPSNKMVAVVQPQKATLFQKQLSVTEKSSSERRLAKIKLTVVKAVFKKKVYVFAEELGQSGLMKELEVTPMRLGSAFGLKHGDPDFKEQLQRQFPKLAHVELTGNKILSIKLNQD